MKRSGQIVLFRFPTTTQERGKLRPALLLAKVPGPFDDWLICMISSQLHQEVEGLDEVVEESDSDFGSSGLKEASLIRVGRLAVVEGNILVGSIGTMSNERMAQIKRKLVKWITGEI